MLLLHLIVMYCMYSCILYHMFSSRDYSVGFVLQGVDRATTVALVRVLFLLFHEIVYILLRIYHIVSCRTSEG